MKEKFVIGLDYGSDSARAVVVNALSGETIATSVCNYPRWAEGKYCNPVINQYRQHPQDYIDALISIVRGTLAQCPAGTAENVVGMAFDTTASTPVAVTEDCTPLAMLPEFSENPNAMFVLWKDHTAIQEASEINDLSKKWSVDYTKYEGGTYSSEWFFAKALHVLRSDENVRKAAWSFIEHCEWMPALLTGCKKTKDVVRSRCAEGHKSMWHEDWGGVPPQEFLSALDPVFDGMRERLFDKTETADKPVGHLCKEWADKLGLTTDVVVAGGAIDCHFGAVGACAGKGALVRIIGTSTCDIMVSPYEEMGKKLIKGICGQVDGSVIPGMIGLEAGQSAFGDVYAWFKRLIMGPVKDLISDPKAVEDADKNFFKVITAQAEKIAPEESSVVATDWLNGRRTPDANQLLKGTITGLTLGSSAPMLFRALVEATAFGSRAIIERFLSEGVNIENVVGIGGIALKNPFVMQILSDVLNMPIEVCKTDQACALGGAMFAATAAGLYKRVEDAQKAMNSGIACKYTPIPENVERYNKLYKSYLALCRATE